MDIKVHEREKDKNELLHDLDEWFRHAETIGQSRLGNFLTSESILVAACALLWEDGQGKPANFLMFILAVLGVLLATFCFFLGNRQKKFHQYIERIADDVIDEMSPEEQKNSVFAKVREFQHGSHRTEDKNSQYKINLNEFEHTFSSRQLLVIGPIVFFVFFFFFLLFIGYSLISL